MQGSLSLRPGSDYISVSGSGMRELNYPLDVVDVVVKTITLTEGECSSHSPRATKLILLVILRDSV